MAGYNEMLRRIEPEKIICYNTPFPEMQGDIVYVDYELSSWKYMSYDRADEKDLECYKIPATNSEKYDIMSAYMVSAGGGSAYGGEWRPNPNKPEDQRFLGTPGEIKTTYDRNGNRIDTKIGQNGRAEKERHYTFHGNPKKHSVPHDHIIIWDERGPHPDSPINYPNGAPEFKKYGGLFMERKIIPCNSLEENRFKTISEFKWCIDRGGEVEFVWNGITYGAIRYGTDDKITLYEAYKPETEGVYDTADDALEYIVGGDRLRDVITQVEVLFRSI